MHRNVRVPLTDGRVVLVGFDEIQLRDQHGRAAGRLTLEEAAALFAAEPEPQRTSSLDVLRRHHGAGGTLG